MAGLKKVSVAFLMAMGREGAGGGMLSDTFARAKRPRKCRKMIPQSEFTLTVFRAARLVSQPHVNHFD